MSLNLSSLEKAVAQLTEILDMCGSEFVRYDNRFKKYFRAAAIQTFEFTYGISLKMLRRHMLQDADSPEEIEEMSFSDLIREAYGKDLVRSDLAAWRKYRESRAITSHTYNEEKAQEVFGIIPDFLNEARYLLGRLQERNGLLD